MSIYRSKFEERIADDLTKRGIEFTYEEYFMQYYKYRPTGVCGQCGSGDVYEEKWYNPDFYIPSLNMFIEAKGKFTSIDRSKMMNVKEDHPNEDIRMLFMYDNKLNRKSITRYTDWCAKKGIICAVGDSVPEEWINA